MDHWIRVLIQDLAFDRGGAPDYVHVGLARAAQIVEEMVPYQFRTDAFEEIAADLSECIEISELSKLMWDAAISAGFEDYIIFVLKNGSGRAMQSRVITSCNSDWLVRYQSQGYQFIDPVMAKALHGDGVFEFADLQSNSPIVAAFWADARVHRIGHNGLCIARTRPDGARMGVSFLTAKTETQARDLARLNKTDLVMIADLAMEAFCYASYGLAGTPEALSDEELRFLYLLSTRKNPHDAFQVRPLYGSNKSLQASIRRKLGVETVFQAVSLATAKGYFDDVPYDSSEVIRPHPDLLGLDAVTLTLADLGDPKLDPEAVPGRTLRSAPEIMYSDPGQMLYMGPKLSQPGLEAESENRSQKG